MKRATLSLVALAALGLMLRPCGALAADETPTSEAGYVGSKACAECHDEQFEAFQSNVHHQAELDGKRVQDVVGCESCHGPGSLHVEAQGDEKDPRFHTIRNPNTMKGAEASAICRKCHTVGDQFYWDQSNHARNNVRCEDCHKIHSPKSQAGARLLSAEQSTELCVTCHRDKRSALEHTAHMPLREGGMSCNDCHNPHGSMGPHMIRAANNTELCVTCHTDKRGPFLWEHPPVRENCVNCHQPHGSNNDKILAGKRPYLCQRCHVSSRHPSTLYDIPDLSASGANKIVNRSCTNCHSQIHGSNHPSGEFFER